MESSNAQESTTTTFEWKLTGLKKIFEASKGDTKSKVVRSVRFGGGKWQILFYPNSGTDGGTHISLYLSCEPTAQEKEAATGGRWVREGSFKFSFDLRNSTKTVIFNSKEACDHSFSYKTANWGWAQFARRDVVFYSSNNVKQTDAFIIVCVIASSPIAPSAPPPLPVQVVPRGLMESMGQLLNNPAYSDVEFVFPAGKPGHEPRRIYAMKGMLTRTDYFNSMLNSGFAEGDSDISRDRTLVAPDAHSLIMTPVLAHDTEDIQMRDIDDSDFDDDAEDDDNQTVEPFLGDSFMVTQTGLTTPAQENDIARETSPSIERQEFDTLTNAEGDNDADEAQETSVAEEGDSTVSRSVTSWQSLVASENVAPEEEQEPPILPPSQPHIVPGPPKMRISVQDVAYRTYIAMLHYLYTDNIVFAPLSSTFLQSGSVSGSATTPMALLTPDASLRNEGQSSNLAPKSSLLLDTPLPGPTTRKEWLEEWRQSNPGRVEPCSAKAMYQLADKLNLDDLKNRAFRHIVKSMTVHNIPHEMFSSFSARFDEVRHVELEFFLTYWNQIRSSDAMKSIWQQIRNGRHPGFEEVWPQIAINLEFKPPPPAEDAGEEKEQDLNQQRNLVLPD